MATVSGPWRRRLRRELAGLIALKIAALALLWWLFFSPAPHAVVTAEDASRRFGMGRPGAVHPQAQPQQTVPLAKSERGAHG